MCKRRNEGKGKLPNKSRSLTREEEEFFSVGKGAAWEFISTVIPKYNLVAALTAFRPTWLPRALHNDCGCGGFHAQ